MSLEPDDALTLRALLGTRVRAECFVLCDAAQVHDGKLFVLGADPPTLTGLFALDHRGGQLVAAFDHGIVAI